MERADGLGGLMSSVRLRRPPRRPLLPRGAADRRSRARPRRGARPAATSSASARRRRLLGRERLFSSRRRRSSCASRCCPRERLRLGAFVVRCNRRRPRRARRHAAAALAAAAVRQGRGRSALATLLDSKFDGRYDDLPATYSGRGRAAWPARATAPGARSWAPRRRLPAHDRRAGRPHSQPRRLDPDRHDGRPTSSRPTRRRDPAAGGESRPLRPRVLDAAARAGRRILGAGYAAAAPEDHCRYLGVLCLIVRTRESVSPYYTLSLTDRRSA